MRFLRFRPVYLPRLGPRVKINFVITHAAYARVLGILRCRYAVLQQGRSFIWPWSRDGRRTLNRREVFRVDSFEVEFPFLRRDVVSEESCGRYGRKKRFKSRDSLSFWWVYMRTWMRKYRGTSSHFVGSESDIRMVTTRDVKRFTKIFLPQPWRKFLNEFNRY